MYFFNPRGWVTTKAGQLWRDCDSKSVPCPGKIQDLQISFQWLFRNRQARTRKEDRRGFKAVQSSFRGWKPGFIEAERRVSLMSLRGQRSKYIFTGVEWWHKRRNYILWAFAPLLSTCTPKRDQAETIHASWVKRDHITSTSFPGPFPWFRDAPKPGKRPWERGCMNMSLLDASHADGREKLCSCK